MRKNVCVMQGGVCGAVLLGVVQASSAVTAIGFQASLVTSTRPYAFELGDTSRTSLGFFTPGVRGAEPMSDGRVMILGDTGGDMYGLGAVDLSVLQPGSLTYYPIQPQWYSPPPIIPTANQPLIDIAHNTITGRTYVQSIISDQAIVISEAIATSNPAQPWSLSFTGLLPLYTPLPTQQAYDWCGLAAIGESFYSFSALNRSVYRFTNGNFSSPQLVASLASVLSPVSQNRFNVSMSAGLDGMLYLNLLNPGTLANDQGVQLNPQTGAATTFAYPGLPANFMSGYTSLVVVPSPSVLALVGAGAGLACVRRRRAS